MNVLFKNRYFRRECMSHTWSPETLVKHLPEKAWCLDYIDPEKGITDFNIICKLCEIGDLRNLKKVRKSVHYKIITNKPFQCINYDFTDGNDTIEKCYIIDMELMISCSNGYLPIVQYLVKQGANIHVNNEGALLWSASNGHLPVVQYLVEQGANIHVDNDEALRYSAQGGYLPAVQYLVEQGANVHACNDDALHWSVRNGHLPIVQYLVKQGANIDANNGVAIRCSIRNDNLEIFRCLAEQGDYVHTHYNTLLQLATYNNSLKVAKYLIEKGGDKSILTKTELKKLGYKTSWYKK